MQVQVLTIRWSQETKLLNSKFACRKERICVLIWTTFCHVHRMSFVATACLEALYKYCVSKCINGSVTHTTYWSIYQ